MAERKLRNRVLRFVFRILFILIIVMLWLSYAPDLEVDELKKKYTNEESEFMSLRGMEVHFCDEGSGPPLLLIHGTAASLHTWEGWTESLKTDFRIIRLDLPGFGLTGPDPEARYQLDEYAQFIQAFMSQLGIEKYSLAGNSLGGGIAWHVAALYPDSVEKLILVDPNGLPKDAPPSMVFRLAKNRITAALLKKFTPRSVIANNLEQVYYRDEKISEDLVTRYQDLTRRAGNRQAFVDRANIKDRPDLKLFSQISCPVLIQWGRHDTWIPASDAELFNAYITNSQVIIYEDAGHVPMEEIPEKSAADVRRFLLEEL